MKYTQIDKTSRISSIRQRIKDLEQQHFQLSLRVDAPDTTSPVSEMDRANLNLLEDSLDRLKTMLQELESQSSPAQEPTSTQQGSTQSS